MSVSFPEGLELKWFTQTEPNGADMNKNWEDLKYLIALERTGSLTAAAKSLRTSSTTLSRKVSAISDRFEQPIFLKKQNSWELTALGRRLFDVGIKLEAALDAISLSIAEAEEIGQIRITSLDFLNRTVLFPNLKSFHEDHPSLNLDLHSSNSNLSLAFGEADIAIRLARPTSGRLQARKLLDMKYSFYAPEGGDVKEWIGREEEFDWIPEIKLAREHFQSDPILRVTDYKAVKDACKRLSVASVLPDVMTFDDTDLVVIPDSHTINREVWLITHESRRNDPSVNIVKKWIIECFEKFRTVLRQCGD